MELKPENKELGKGVISEDWELKRLGDHVTFLRSGVYSRAELTLDDPVKYLHYGDIHSCASVKLDPASLPSLPSGKAKNLDRLRDGDLVFADASEDLVGVSKSVELCGVSNTEIVSGLHTIVARFDKDTLANGFKSYLQFCPDFCGQLRKLAAGTKVYATYRSHIASIEMRLPGVNEQKIIAAVLSDADALLDGLDRLIAKKRELKHAVMQQLLTSKTRLLGFEGEWEVKLLGDIADIVMGQSPNSSNYNSRGDGLPLIQGNSDIVDRRTIKRIFTTQITKRGNEGDVLMSVRAPVGEISRALFDVCLGRGVCAIRFPNDFLYHLLIFLEPAWAKHSKGSTFDSINSGDIKAVEVELPSDPEEQIAIAAVLTDMDGEIFALEQRRKKAKFIKQAMMQELLTGRTRLVEPEEIHA